ncbi:lipopolysaccharide biosynthesis protein [Paenibacillus donghaensis]|uniref:Polysaccharide biosynthesis protein n=1 Tax=Paenibacillus donghaensis TaxID=414771 RepID=A0A2Z2KD07_9BACL|nr:hypothetical protein [Paenibacillus donghaensis]ASA23804.1 hypothetical protein B9T62_25290 [Paenibacillus donghaensis]
MKIDFLKTLSNEKDKVMVNNIIASFLIKGAALLISFFSLPAYIKYFDNQNVLGVWYTVLSVLTWILSFDFGIGNGLRNNLVAALVRNDKLEIRRYISSAYFIIGAVVVTITLVGSIFFKFINWNSIFNISETLISASTMLFVLKCVFYTIMLQLFFGLISSILYALQKSAINNLITLITSASQFVFILFFKSVDIETNIKMLSVVFLLCVNLPLIVTTIIIFSTSLKGAFPSYKYLNKRIANGILQLGGMFFLNQIMYMLITGTNSLLITKFNVPESVVDYQIYYRLFSLPGMLFMLALTPLWSAITRACEERDVAWINKYFKLLHKFVIILIFLQFIMIPFLQLVINVWLGDNSITVEINKSLIFALFGSVFIYQSVLSTFACGIGEIKLQLFFYSVGVVFKLFFIVIGMSLFNDWIIVVLSDIVILLPYCFFQFIALKRHFSIMKH